MSRINGERVWMPNRAMWFDFTVALFILFTNLWKYGTGVPRDREADAFVPSNRKNVRKTPRNAEIDVARESRLFRWLMLDLHFSSAKFACTIRSFVECKYYMKKKKKKKKCIKILFINFYVYIYVYYKYFVVFIFVE